MLWLAGAAGPPRRRPPGPRATRDRAPRGRRVPVRPHAHGPAIIPLLMLVPLLVVPGQRRRHRPVGLRRGPVLRVLPGRVLRPPPYTPADAAAPGCAVDLRGVTLFTVIANPYTANAVEWLHAWLLTGGALVVGWSIGREGHARLALTLLLLACVLLGHRRRPGRSRSRPRGLQRGLPVAAVPDAQERRRLPPRLRGPRRLRRPPWVRWPPVLRHSCFWICAGGIVFTQSRQAMVGLAVALVVLVLAPRPGRSAAPRSSCSSSPAARASSSSWSATRSTPATSSTRSSSGSTGSGLDRRLAERPDLRRRTALVVHRPVRGSSSRRTRSWRCSAPPGSSACWPSSS